MKKLLLTLILLAACAGAGPLPGPQNPGTMRYNYGPSILWNSEAVKWQAWWCGPKLDSAGKVIGGDAIWYSDSADASAWSQSRIVFQAAASGWDSYHTCDPSVLRNVKLAGVMRPYVLYYTGADGKSGGDNDGRIGVAYSSDGLNWSEKGGIFSAHPAWWAPYDLAAVDNEVWAPDIAVYNGRAYLYYSVTAKNAVGGNVSAIGLVSAASVAELVAGRFTDHGLILNSTSYPSSKFNAIDPSLVLDKEGQPWLVFGGDG